MKRFTVMLTVMLAVSCGAAIGGGGCASDDGGQTVNNPFGKKAPASSAAKSPDQADYFMLKKDGKTYVVGSNDSRNALMAGETPNFRETTFENGKTVYVENASYKDYNRLVAQYKKDAGL